MYQCYFLILLDSTMKVSKNTISLYPDTKAYHSNGIIWCFVSLQVSKCPESHLKQHSKTWLWSVWYLFGSYVISYPQCLYTAHATLSSGLPKNFPRVICNFSVYTRAVRRVAARMCTKKNTNVKYVIPWYITRERMPNTINARYTRRMLGRLNAIPSNM